MSGTLHWLTDLLSLALPAAEREAVLGDLEEKHVSGPQALRDILDLVLRRQAALWKRPSPWIALLGLAAPFGYLLRTGASDTAYGNAITIWLYANNWDPAFWHDPAFQQDFAPNVFALLLSLLLLACWSWTIGLAIGTLSRRATFVNSAALCLVMLTGLLHPASPRAIHSAVFAVKFYRVAFPWLITLLLAVAPAILGARAGTKKVSLRSPLGIAAFATLGLILLASLGLNTGSLDYWPALYWIAAAIRTDSEPRPSGSGPTHKPMSLSILTTILTLAALPLTAADPQPVRVTIQPTRQRKPAPEFALEDPSGNIAGLKQYRGKIVLVDFWATWCHGCKEEIPWFSEFERKYSSEGLAVIGISLDNDGWKAVKPFLSTTDIPYRIVLGNDQTAKKYGIETMPDTFLIDRRGRIAATYTGLVDRANIEANIKSLLSQRH